MAIRNRGCGRRQRRRLPQHIHECALDPAGVVGDRRDAPRLRSYLLHHHHRHPFRSPALQDGSPLAHPIRQDLQKWLAAQGQRDSARVERPLPSAKPKKRLAPPKVSGIPRGLSGLFLRQNLKKRLATQGQRDSAWVERPLPPASPLERGRLHSAEPASALKSCSPKLPDHNNPAMIYHNNPAMIERDLPSLELAERIK